MQQLHSPPLTQLSGCCLGCSGCLHRLLSHLLRFCQLSCRTGSCNQLSDALGCCQGSRLAGNDGSGPVSCIGPLSSPGSSFRGLWGACQLSCRVCDCCSRCGPGSRSCCRAGITSSRYCRHLLLNSGSRLHGLLRCRSPGVCYLLHCLGCNCRLGSSLNGRGCACTLCRLLGSGGCCHCC